MRWSGLTPTSPAPARRKARPGGEPLSEQIPRQFVAQCHLGHLIEPGLGDVQNQQRPCDDDEDEKLRGETRKVFARKRIIKRSAPCVEFDLPVDGGADHKREPRAKPKQNAAPAGIAKDFQYRLQMRNEAVTLGLTLGVGPIRPIDLVFHGCSTHLRALPITSPGRPIGKVDRRTLSAGMARPSRPNATGFSQRLY